MTSEIKTLIHDVRGYVRRSRSRSEPALRLRGSSDPVTPLFDLDPVPWGHATLQLYYCSKGRQNWILVLRIFIFKALKSLNFGHFFYLRS